MPFSVGQPVAGTDSGLAVKVTGSSAIGSGILIDSTHVLTAAHVILGSTGTIAVDYLSGTSGVVHDTALASSIKYVQGQYQTPGGIARPSGHCDHQAPDPDRPAGQRLHRPSRPR